MFFSNKGVDGFLYAEKEEQGRRKPKWPRCLINLINPSTSYNS